ncbi:MAG TPA: type II toxin-antitoxin system HigB family toxin [Oscillatoriaceae cyanobacterium M33_DOE_052]|uniref:Type II toxin-antitoxin system HigB family toxin n=1 Tax=Planktothricoides sp. SpSt-374 TaxID=2282167 RepID=A0A7C3VPL2_9CYAN|nr:type II toxin-antitoxin system HigB family toxin [Oscillatoriaceae cyanobacterium M33_DOE_052]
MHIISKSPLKDFWSQHPAAKTALKAWYKQMAAANYANLAELKQTVTASADIVGNFTVFNIGGNKFRLIAFIDYQYRKVFIRAVLTHEEYDQEKWKKDPWFN